MPRKLVNKQKTITTTIEDEIFLLSNVDVEFVSLVKHGANRIPFQVLKEEKGGNQMNKVVTSILIPANLDAEKVEKYLDGYRTDEVEEFDSFKSYTQVAKEDFDPDTADVIHLGEEGDKVLAVVAALKEEAKDEEKVVEKEALDYATLDSLYEELYAMADIVSGACRQQSVEGGMRRKTILSAIDNFRSFAEMLLKAIKDEDLKAVTAGVLKEVIDKADALDAECPDCGWAAGLASDAIGKVIHKGCTNPMEKVKAAEEKEEDVEEKEQEAEETEAEEKTENQETEAEATEESTEEAKEEETEVTEEAEETEEKEEDDAAKQLAESMKESFLKDVSDVLSGALVTVNDSIKELKESNETLSETVAGIQQKFDEKDAEFKEVSSGLSEKLEKAFTDIEKIKTTPKSSKSEKDEESGDNDPPQKGQFTGTLFKTGVPQD